MKCVNGVPAFIFIVVLVSACSKMIDTKPPISSINSENVYAENATAIGVLTGIYVNLVNSFTGSTTQNISLRAGLSADELVLFSGVTNADQIATYQNKLVSNITNSFGGAMWSRLYTFLFFCNSAIDGLSNSQSLNANVKQQLLGEALFMRAFCYFYLVNLYGDAPIVLTTDPLAVQQQARSSTGLVYQQIIKDLKESQNLLSTSFLNKDLMPYANASIERVRPTKWVATALLARVYLYTKEYGYAEAESSKIINETSLFDTVPVNMVFGINNKEAIWQLQPIRTGRNSEDAFLFIIPTTGPSASTNPVYLSDALVNSFESGDKRAVLGNWINRRVVTGITYYYPYKYKATTGAVSEYPVVFRLAEQYLIRAEARVMLGKISGNNSGQSDLNIVRYRAGLPSTTASDKDGLVAAILRERRVELFTEWGHRWLDMKRLGVVDAVMNQAAVYKGTTWNSYQQWYPLPFGDIQASTALKQNEGYF
ncbi:RagB/SusD family nutrient uptake outer membrane protein [Filimonas effusa]|uniref:RagB/SusD family nutrient uptake outer membrane protein n=1 Tax=Filimonas effusa TaxID=2508721 RepID=A0A4Q1D1T7_9BACT|nr:RagB/SusD family nutrient uptake outer membrane protein [Filimonas effusa]RXK81754.1 RagB/SusD family nutrient uptake outer membrane protein [Filimonas effusa]